MTEEWADYADAYVYGEEGAYRYAPLDYASVEELGEGVYGAALRFLDYAPRDWLLAWPPRDQSAESPVLFQLERTSGCWRQAWKLGTQGGPTPDSSVVATVRAACEESALRARDAWYEAGTMTLGGLVRDSISGEPGPRGGKSEREKADGSFEAALGKIVRACEPRYAREVAAAIGVLAIQRRVVGMPSVRECHEDDLDSLRYLGAPNGVIDLWAVNGEPVLLAPDSEEAITAYVTRQLPDDFKEGAEHPDIDRLLAAMDCPQAKEYVWREIAAALHGQPNDELILIVSEANSGKTTFANAVMHSLGDYATTLHGDALVERNQRNPALERLFPPRRIAFMSEVQQHKLNEAAIKRATGGEKLSFRFLYSNRLYESAPTALMVISGNGMPSAELGINNADGGMRRRVRAIPFASIPEGERQADAGMMLRGWQEDRGEKARARRQALVAMLVSKARMLGPGAHFEPPECVKDELDRLAQLDGGESVQWIRANIQRRKDGNLTVDEFWMAAKAADGAASTDKQAFGLNRQQLIGQMRRITGAPAARNVKTDGRITRCWRDYALSEAAQETMAGNWGGLA